MRFLSQTAGNIDLFFIRAVDNDTEEHHIALEKILPRLTFKNCHPDPNLSD